MIQRIQTLWLFVAAAISALLMLDTYPGYVFKADVPQGFGSVVTHLRVMAHFPSLLLAVAMIILPFAAIFFFKNRKRQRSFVWLSILVCVGFTMVSLMRIENFKNTSPMPRNGSYELGMVVPALAILFLLFAIRGIRKDDKLIKSMDRLR